MYTNEDFCRDFQRFSGRWLEGDLKAKMFTFCEPYIKNASFVEDSESNSPNWNILMLVFGGLTFIMYFCMIWKKLKNVFQTIEHFIYGYVNQVSQELQITRIRNSNQTNSNVLQNPEIVAPSNLRDMPLEILMNHAEQENLVSSINSQIDSNSEHVLPSYDEVLALEEKPPSYREAVNSISNHRKNFWKTFIFKENLKK